MTTCSRVEGLPRERPRVCPQFRVGERDWRRAYKVKIEFQFKQPTTISSLTEVEPQFEDEDLQFHTFAGFPLH